MMRRVLRRAGLAAAGVARRTPALGADREPRGHRAAEPDPELRHECRCCRRRWRAAAAARLLGSAPRAGAGAGGNAHRAVAGPGRRLEEAGPPAARADRRRRTVAAPGRRSRQADRRPDVPGPEPAGRGCGAARPRQAAPAGGRAGRRPRQPPARHRRPPDAAAGVLGTRRRPRRRAGATAHPGAGHAGGQGGAGRRDYAAAEAAAREVLDGQPHPPRAYDAQFLLAEALAGQRQYSQAALALRRCLQPHAHAARMPPDALIGLANALAALTRRPRPARRWRAAGGVSQPARRPA